MGRRGNQTVAFTGPALAALLGVTALHAAVAGAQEPTETVLPARTLSEPAEPRGSEIDARPGRFVVDPERSATEQSGALAPRGEGFSATYANAEVALVVNQILGEFLGLDYTIGPNVRGQITLRITDLRTRQQAIDTLRAALEPLGIAVVERGGFVAVVQGVSGAVGDIAVLGPGDAAPPGAGVAVLIPRYIAPSQVSGLIGPFAPPGVVALADDERNFMVLRGEEAAITSASEAVALFDVDWFSQISVASFDLDYVSPDIIAGELPPLLGPAAVSVEIVPLERLSKLIVLARNADALEAVRMWVARLDAPADRAAMNGLLIYDARYADAETLASSIVRLMGGGATSGSASNDRSLSVAAGSRDTGSRGDPRAGEFEPSRDIADGRDQRGGAGSAARLDGVIIVADPDQNAVIARGEDAQIAEVRVLLEALDRPRAQVLIEATIVEVTLNDELRYGVNWAGVEDERIRAIFTDAPNGAVAARFPGFSVSYVNTDIEAALSLLASVTEIEVVSRPSVIALHNELAELQIGDQVPIVTQSAVSVVNPDAPIVNQTTYRDTGVILSVIPRVRAGGTVEIEILQEVSDVARTTSSGIDSPTITQRRIASTLLVPSGEAVALGGLISTSRATGETGVPVLRRAPVVGQLFRTNSDLSERTELIVFLTPRVLADPRQAVDATTQMRAAMRRLEALLAEQ
ncbi:MAG: secretin N-terminal domain-containing protein [Maricaulaceae bacterium]